MGGRWRNPSMPVPLAAFHAMRRLLIYDLKRAFSNATHPDNTSKTRPRSGEALPLQGGTKQFLPGSILDAERQF